MVIIYVFQSNYPIAKLQISFRKESHTIEIPLSSTIRELKDQISAIVSLPPTNLKLMYKKTSKYNVVHI